MAFGWKKRMDAKDDVEKAEAEASAEPDMDEQAHGDAAADDPAATILRLEAERDEALANWQRAMADYQNLRRRMQSDIDAATRRARGEVLGEALTVLDYLDMALATECTTEEGKNLQVGVSMTRGQLASLLERFKVKVMPATKEFDAAYHQAFATVETEGVPPGSIVEVFRKGWLYNDQVLRHAQVRVAAAPSVATEGEGTAQDAEVTDLPDETNERVSD
jgi:molecular chaperone GrpE